MDVADLANTANSAGVTMYLMNAPIPSDPISAAHDSGVSVAQELLAHDMSVILEWGHWARRERDEKRLRARNLDAHVELQYLDVPLDVLIARIERRQRSGEWIDAPITRAQMERWAATFEAPDDAELALFDPPTTAAPAKL